MALGLHNNTTTSVQTSFCPSELSPEIWLHLHNANQLTVNEDNSISEWKNNGSAEDYTQISAARKPTAINNSLESALYQRAISFDGGDYLQSVTETRIGANGYVAIVHMCDDWGAGNQAFLGDVDSNNSFIRTSNDTTFYFKAYDGSGYSQKGLGINSPAALVDATFYAFIFNYNSVGNIDCYINGVLQTSSPTHGADFYWAIQEIGAKNGVTQTLTGDIKSVVAGNIYLDSDQVVKLNNYLQRYIG